MAGVTVDNIRERTGSTRVTRALPNAAAEIGFAYTPFFVASSETGDAETVGALFRSCGEVDLVSREADIDYLRHVRIGSRISGTSCRGDDE
ncbi:pyrroline-5-carboxylate reductase [compost metagenome]